MLLEHEVVELTGGPDRIEYGAPCGLADEVGVRTCGAQPDVVSGHHDPSVVDDLIQCRGRAGSEWLVQKRRGATFGDAGGAMRPRDDRSRSGREVFGGYDDGAGHRGLAVIECRRVEQPVRLRIIRDAADERLASQKLAGFGWHV